MILTNQLDNEHIFFTLKQLNQTHALVYLPTHRSYADAFILSRLLRDHGLKRNHILGGNNLGFWPLGTIIRRSGGILIRRNFQDDQVYKLVVREYLAWLAAQRMNLEWYMEGGRSRTGKLRPRETIAQGIASAPEAFLGLLKGKNFGKQLVKLI